MFDTGQVRTSPPGVQVEFIRLVQSQNLSVVTCTAPGLGQKPAKRLPSFPILQGLHIYLI